MQWSLLSPLSSEPLRKMAPGKPRRSPRLDIVESNGRDYLADTMGWTREELEEWVSSSSVKPHLQRWHQICVAGRNRLNDAIGWLSTGNPEYYNNAEELEEDLLLMCLGEGTMDNQGDLGEGGEGESFRHADKNVKTTEWTTQELWARTAWRIVQNNKGVGEVFEKRAEAHPAACYGFTIDLVCLAFHSIAFRGRASIWEQLINGSTTAETTKSDGNGLSRIYVDKQNKANSSSTALATDLSAANPDSSSDAMSSEAEHTTPTTRKPDNHGMKYRS